jgi:hypothetical protein
LLSSSERFLTSAMNCSPFIEVPPLALAECASDNSERPRSQLGGLTLERVMNPRRG